MKNKIVSISLVVVLSLPTLNAGSFSNSFDSTTTSGGSWKDDNTGMTYTSFGKKSFSFKKRTSSFTPWFKGTPPSINAGCGGISLDGGFVAFLDLEEIGKQLETAISSVGMGVIVVLVQTLPSIGKAFEDVQKLVRKLQSMLQNACQLTTSALSNNKNLQDAKSNMSKKVNKEWGDNYATKKMQGATQWLNDATNAINCPTSDAACNKNKDSIILSWLGSGRPKSKQGASSKVTIIGDVDKIIVSKIISKINGKRGVHKSDIGEILKNNTFKDTVKDGENYLLGLDQAVLTMAILKYSLFGIYSVSFVDSIASKLDAEGSIIIDEALTLIAADKSSDISSEVKYTKSGLKVSEIGEFLIGDHNGTIKYLTIPNNQELIITVECKNTDDTGCKSDKTITVELTDKEVEGTGEVVLEWKGIYKQTYQTLMHSIDSSTVDPTITFGNFIPRGGRYLSIIKEYAGGSKDTALVPYYVDLLAKINVIFTLKNLISEIKALTLETTLSGTDLVKYTNNANLIVDELESVMSEYPDDVEFLDHLQNIFLGLEKENRLTRTKGKR